MKGLTVNVYRNGRYDSTNGGDSSHCDELTVVGIPDADIFEATPERPAYKLEMHVRGVVRLVPVEGRDGNKFAGPMFGGNYAATSDSRFGAAIEKLTGQRFYGAVAIHDRYETWKQYDALSR